MVQIHPPLSFALKQFNNKVLYIPYKSKEDLYNYRKQRRSRKKDGLPTRLYPLSGEAKRRSEEREMRFTTGTTYTEKKRGLIGDYLGDECVICGYIQQLVSHRKDGAEHTFFADMRLDELHKELEEHHVEYARLCYQCHSRVHWCMDRLGLTWDDIEKMAGVIHFV